LSIYKDRRNYKDHDFNNTTFTINKEHKAEGLNRITVTMTEDEVAVQTVADGLGLFVNNPKISGSIVFETLEASATNQYMWDMWRAKTSFATSILDKVVPDLNVAGAKCRIMKRADIERVTEATVSEWTILCVYLDSDGGGFTLESA